MWRIRSGGYTAFCNMDRFIFHVDANSAFLSWSAAYRVHVLGEKIDLRDLPSIVGGDQEKRHGIVLAKSIPSKKYGIQTGESVLEAKQRELMQIEQSIQQAQQDFSKEIQELQQRLQTPIIEEATQVVNDLAKAKGVAVVFEKSSFLYVDPEQVVDLTPEARIILEIPEGRTLETLQAELMAKAQAAQQ